MKLSPSTFVKGDVGRTKSPCSAKQPPLLFANIDGADKGNASTAISSIEEPV